MDAPPSRLMVNGCKQKRPSGRLRVALALMKHTGSLPGFNRIGRYIMSILRDSVSQAFGKTEKKAEIKGNGLVSSERDDNVERKSKVLGLQFSNDLLNQENAELRASARSDRLSKQKLRHDINGLESQVEKVKLNLDLVNGQLAEAKRTIETLYINQDRANTRRRRIVKELGWANEQIERLGQSLREYEPNIDDYGHGLVDGLEGEES